MDTTVLAVLITAVPGAIAALLAASLKRNVSAVDKVIDEIRITLKEVLAKVTIYESAVAVVGERQNNLSHRLQKMEEWLHDETQRREQKDQRLESEIQRMREHLAQLGVPPFKG